MKKIVAATHNKGKLNEMREILTGWEILSVADFDNGVEPEENGKTFRENALIKARAAYERSGLPSFGDDSGLCVDALDGAPGVHSARYAPTPEARIDKLLGELKDVADERRTAHFTCAVAYKDGENEFTVEARTDGYILREREGEGGFGYDPIFFSSDLGKTFGAAASEEKNAVSHRGRALKLFAEKLKTLNVGGQQGA